MTFLLMVTLMGNLAGPVGDYLGLAQGKWWAYETVEKDSSLLPPQVTVDTSADTLRVTAEFLFDGHPAYQMESGRNDTVGVDTTWEVGNSLMGFLKIPVDSTKDTSLPWTDYTTPFELGLQWHDSLKFITDLNGDMQLDTAIYIDSARVVAQENITVPYGTVTDAYKIERKMRMVFTVHVATIAMVVGIDEAGFEWFKPGLGRVKDTMNTVVWNYGLMGLDTTISDYIWQSRVLVGIPVGIEEKSVKLSPSITIGDNLFRNELSLSFSLEHPGILGFSLYDAAGRKAASTVEQFPAGRSSLKLATGNLPAGVYILIVSQDDKLITQKKVVKVE
jgi:hypothetical protein